MNVSAERYQLELMCDGFITGIQSYVIRQRLLVESTLNFKDAYRKARAMELALRIPMRIKELLLVAQGWDRRKSSMEMMSKTWLMQTTSVKQLCYFFGNAQHPYKNCPAKDAVCNFCQKVGHYFKVCQKRLGNRGIDATKKTAAMQWPKLTTLSASETSSNTRVLCNVKIKSIVAKSLMDTGSSDCYIDRRFANKHSFNIRRAVGEVILAETSVRIPIRSQCITYLLVENNEYSDLTFNVLDNLATDVIIGEKIFKKMRALRLPLRDIAFH